MTHFDFDGWLNRSLSSSWITPPPTNHMMVYYIFTSLGSEQGLPALILLVHHIHHCHPAEVSVRSCSMLKEQITLLSS